MAHKPAVIIYRDRLLSPSETFVRSQGEALQDFTPYYVGSRLAPGLMLPRERTLVVNQGGLFGKAIEAAHKLGGFAPTLVRRLRKLDPLLIHAHFGTDGTVALPLARNLHIPLIVTFHGFDATVKDEYARRSFYSHRAYLRRREALKQQCHLFVAVSNFIKRKLVEQGFPPDRIVVHYIGVDTDLFQPDPTVQRESVVLFVGRLITKKGCEYLIRAMSKVQAKMPEAELVVIGEGPLRPALEKLAKETLHRYQFLGVQPPEKVRTWMNQAKVFCVPSNTSHSGDAEGFGIVFAEAQAMGLPVVSFVTGGVPEAVSDGETGFLANENDWEGLARHIISLLEDKTLWHQLSENGQKRVRTSFNLQKQTRLLEDIYQQVLSEKDIDFQRINLRDV